MRKRRDKDPGGQGNNGKTGEPVKGGEITIGIAQDLDDSLEPTRRWPQEPGKRSCSTSFEGLVKPNSDGEIDPRCGGEIRAVRGWNHLYLHAS